MEIDVVGPLPPSNGSTYILTAVDLLPRYVFGTTTKRADGPSVVKGRMSIFTRHAYIPNTILTDKGTAFTAEV